MGEAWALPAPVDAAEGWLPAAPVAAGDAADGEPAAEDGALGDPAELAPPVDDGPEVLIGLDGEDGLEGELGLLMLGEVDAEEERD